MKITVTSFLLPLFLFFHAVTSAQDVKKPQPDTVKARNGYVEETVGGLTKAGNYKNGLKDGVWISRQYDGRTRKIETFSEGKKNGLFMDVDVTGYVLLDEMYKNDLLNGLCIKYYNGRMKSKITYKEGIRDGVSVSYYEGGGIMEEAVYRNGKKNGLCKWFDPEVKLVAAYSYKDDLFEGVNRTYSKKVQIMLEETYRANVLHGSYKEYYDEAKIKVDGFYVNGLKDDTWTEYDENGNVIKVTKYRKGNEVD